jgi:dihydrolipoamide dehydrogenase
VVDRILPAEDREISDFARKTFEKKGIKIHTEANVEKVDKGKNGATATIKTKDGKTQQLEVDKVVLSVGIVANTENLGLDGTKVQVEKSHIKTDQWMRTGEPGVYAIGDATGAPWLAHKASHEGVICVEKIAGLNDVHPLDYKKIPACTYCTPQVASVGLSEQAAQDAGHKVKVGRFPYRGNGKALAMGEDNGMVKTVFDETTGELLGAHLIGAEVTELIQGYSIAQTLETTETELMHTVFPHPTLSEMMHESVLDAYGRAIHF